MKSLFNSRPRRRHVTRRWSSETLETRVLLSATTPTCDADGPADDQSADLGASPVEPDDGCNAYGSYGTYSSGTSRRETQQDADDAQDHQNIGAEPVEPDDGCNAYGSYGTYTSNTTQTHGEEPAGNSSPDGLDGTPTDNALRGQRELIIGDRVSKNPTPMEPRDGEGATNLYGTYTTSSTRFSESVAENRDEAFAETLHDDPTGDRSLLDVI